MPDLISFDIDGTLEVGEPRGSITMDFVRRVQSLGYIVGSCSDRPLSYQEKMWQEHDISVDFTVLKQNLGDVKARFEADEYTHIGDSAADEYYALKSGFRFIEIDTMEWLDWSEHLLTVDSGE